MYVGSMKIKFYNKNKNNKIQDLNREVTSCPHHYLILNKSSEELL